MILGLIVQAKSLVVMLYLFVFSDPSLSAWGGAGVPPSLSGGLVAGCSLVGLFVADVLLLVLEFLGI